MAYLSKITFFVSQGADQNAGYSIIEVMISLAIFAIGILGIATLQILATNGNTNARKYSEASEIAQGQIEALMAMPYATVVDDTFLTTSGYAVQWVIENQQDMDGDGDGDLMEVQVIVADSCGKTRADLRFKKAADF
jgi:prepilin-type N-terminal cleavage/methylation domain-containing protein